MKLSPARHRALGKNSTSIFAEGGSARLIRFRDRGGHRGRSEVARKAVAGLGVPAGEPTSHRDVRMSKLTSRKDTLVGDGGEVEFVGFAD